MENTGDILFNLKEAKKLSQDWKFALLGKCLCYQAIIEIYARDMANINRRLNI